MPSDPLMQDPKGLVGALIIEPQGASWVEDANTRASATVTKADGSQFREFVVVIQNDVEVGPGTAFNYRTEPITSRYPSTTPAFTAAATSKVIEGWTTNKSRSRWWDSLPRMATPSTSTPWMLTVPA